MAIIKVTAQELKKGLPLDPKWYPGHVKELKLEPSKDKTKVNNTLIVVLDDGSDEGRELKQTIFNNDLKPLFEACLSTEEEPFVVPMEDYGFDTDLVAGKALNIKIENEIYQGRPVPKIKGFLPAHIDVSTIPF